MSVVVWRGPPCAIFRAVPWLLIHWIHLLQSRARVKARERERKRLVPDHPMSPLSSLLKGPSITEMDWRRRRRRKRTVRKARTVIRAVPVLRVEA